MAAPMLADPAMLGHAEPGLPDPRNEPETAHQLLPLPEAGNLAARRDDAGGHGHVDAGYGEQPLDPRVLYGVLGDIAVQDSKIFAQPVDLADMAVDRSAFVVGHHRLLPPDAPPAVEQIGVRTLRNKMRLHGSHH